MNAIPEVRYGVVWAKANFLEVLRSVFEDKTVIITRSGRDDAQIVLGNAYKLLPIKERLELLKDPDLLRPPPRIRPKE